ncbi:MAG TPA: PHP domain-containing protein [Clostridia bacterium]|nr:PHP domain-containing protein [Clostridia bacterium]
MNQSPIASDLHTHTVFSHGKGTPEENVLAAVRLGLKRVAVSEHAAAHVFYGVRGEKLRSLRREIDRLSAKYARDIEVLMGYECNLTGFGECDAPKDRAMFDVLLLAFHKGVPPRDALARSAFREAVGLGRADPVRVAEALLAAADKYRIDILAHPGAYVAADAATLAKGAAELGVMLEINSSRVTFTPDEARLAAALGARFCVNSDAHTPSRVGDFAAAIDFANRAGVVVEEWRPR